MQRELVAAADPGRLAWLLGKLQVEDAHRVVTREGPRISRAVRRLESWLESRLSRLLREQRNQGGLHHDGDPLWRPGVGWALASEEAKMSDSGQLVAHLQRRAGVVPIRAAGFYVNVARAAE